LKNLGVLFYCLVFLHLIRMYVYLINRENTNVYKIGITKNKPQRMRALQTGADEKLILVKFFQSKIAKEVEGVLHRQYYYTKFLDLENTLKGEFFRLEPKDVLSFLDNCKRIEDNLYVIKNNSTLFDK